MGKDSVGGVRTKVLIVEDDPAVLASMVAMLDDTMIVDTCENAEIALTKTLVHRYHVVCADYGLPKMSGLELLEQLGQRSPGFRGLLVTGSEDFYRISKRRGYYVLKKPFDPERYVAIVEHLASLAMMRQSVDLLASGPNGERK